MLRRIIAALALGAGLTAQTLQQDMQKISDEFAKLPPTQEIAQQYKDPQRALVWIELIRMNTRSAEEAEVRARYAHRCA